MTDINDEQPSWPSCCRRIKLASQGPARVIEVAPNGLILICAQGGVKHRIQYCPFCGTPFPDVPETTTDVNQLSCDDLKLLDTLQGISNIEELVERFGPADSVMTVFAGTGKQYVFQNVLHSGDLIVIEGIGSLLEIIGSPGHLFDGTGPMSDG